MTVRTIDDLFRDFVIDGVPSSGPFNPHKPDIRDTLKKLLEGISTFPDNRVIRLNNGNTGTPNNIIVSASVDIPAAAFQVLYILNVTRTNTGPVKVSGAINRDLVTNTSAAVPNGYLTPGMAVLCIDTGTALRMLSYGDMETIIRDAEAAQAAAELARDIAAGYASDAVSQGNVPIYSSLASIAALEIPVGINVIRVNGRTVAGDGQGGVYIATNNGSTDTGVSGGSTSRTWYRVLDVNADRIRAGAISAPKITDDTALQNAILEKIGGVSKRAQALTNAERSQIILNIGMAPSQEPTGRLTLIEGMAVAGSNVANSPNIYYTAVSASFVPLWDGEGFISRYFGNQLVLALTDQAAGFNIDLYIARINNVIYLVSGQNWQAGGGEGNGRYGRGTGEGSAEVELLNGIAVNRFAQTVKYGNGLTTSVPARMMTLVGTFRPRLNGYAEDSQRFRNLSNLYNAVKRTLMTPEIYALNHQWAPNSWHTVNGEVGQFIGVVQTVSSRLVSASFSLRVGSNAPSAALVHVGIGHNSNAFDHATVKDGAQVNNVLPGLARAQFNKHVGTGYHELYLLERGAAQSPYVQTWSADYGNHRLIGECIN